jgi:hypothetical protein
MEGSWVEVEPDLSSGFVGQVVAHVHKVERRVEAVVGVHGAGRKQHLARQEGFVLKIKATIRTYCDHHVGAVFGLERLQHLFLVDF